MAEPRAIAGLRRVSRVLGAIEAGIVAVFLAALVAVGAFQAISRNFFAWNPDWVDPIIRSSVFLIGLGGAALAAQSDRLINIDILSRAFPFRTRLALRVVALIFGIFVCWWFVQAGMTVVATERNPNDEALIKGEWVALSLPVSFVLIAFHLAVQAVIDGWSVASGREPPRPEGDGPGLHL